VEVRRQADDGRIADFYEPVVTVNEIACSFPVPCSDIYLMRCERPCPEYCVGSVALDESDANVKKVSSHIDL
jgi:hypothetical protein